MYHGLQNLVYKYLHSEPRFRERRNRMRGIANLLQEKYPKLQEVDKQILIDAIEDADSMNRYWRLILAENKELQGTDYDTKKVYEQKKEVELGYEPNYHKDVKQGQLI